MKVDALVIRCDAGLKYGLGHLYRCITLAQVFKVNSISFVIRTDNIDLVHSLVQSTFFDSSNQLEVNLKFLDTNVTQPQELEALQCELRKTNALLFLDHYEIDDHYQKYLLAINVKWLQFDSYAKINLYANWVLHGSTAATKSMYMPLVKNSKSKLLVGANYAIIKKEVRELRDYASKRIKLSQILICFGGGNDFGATLKVLNLIDSLLAKNISFKVSVRGSEKYIDSIKQASKKFTNFELIHHNDLTKSMLESDLAIVAPGMISYEAACLGLPMLLVSTADNQSINANGWRRSGCAELLGTFDKLNEHKINHELHKLRNSQTSLTELSANCLESIDGQGVFRVHNTILGDY